MYEQTTKILIVDDEPMNVCLLETILAPFNYAIFSAYSGEDALRMVSEFDIDLILLDVVLPGMDGFEVCQRLKSVESTRLIPIVMVTALGNSQDRVKGIEAGADDFISKPPDKIELTARIKSLLKVNALNKKLTALEDIMLSMANAVEAKDAYTEGHNQRVAGMAVALGQKMALSQIEIDALWVGGVLHDIGKIGVPESILNKPAKLDHAEMETVMKHPTDGYKICLPLKKSLGMAIEIILHHHEKLDGSGYPEGLKGDEISLLSRIVGIVDIFDALDTDRPYHKGFPRGKSIRILRDEATQGKIDGDIVEQLVTMLAT